MGLDHRFGAFLAAALDLKWEASTDSKIWNGTMVPSKLQGIFAAARPVLLVGSHASSIGRWIEEKSICL